MCFDFAKNELAPHMKKWDEEVVRLLCFELSGQYSSMSAVEPQYQ